MFSRTATENAVLWNTCVDSGTNMVTNDFKVLDEALVIVKEFVSKGGDFKCPFCEAGTLSEDQLLSIRFCTTINYLAVI